MRRERDPLNTLELLAGCLVMALVSLLAVVVELWLALRADPAGAADLLPGAGKMVAIPHDASRYRADLTRSARLAWGLDAPLATFAAQIHQESLWRADARSHVGARGLAQIMPATERWIAGVYSRELAEADAGNPVWAMRAMTRYDRWIWERAPDSGAGMGGTGTTNPPRPPFSKGGGASPLDGDKGGSDCRRMAATLRGYNGGLGWVLKEARSGRPCEAFRAAASCRENLGYPRRILGVLEPVYVRAGWGYGVCG